MRFSSPTLYVAAASVALLIANTPPFPTASTDIQMPGTQPLQASLAGAVTNCEGCHGHYDQAVEPFENWNGSMMSHAGRDPIFWAALAVADGDVPGAGDFCLRCHTPRGWHEGRATATDGSLMDPVVDANGIECSLCHQLVNPDQSEHPGHQYAPYLANNGGTPPEGFYGSGMQVLAGNNTRYGPYASTSSPHGVAQSLLHRSPELCGTCHDVSNPLVGDLAPNNGAMTPLAPGTFSGVPGAPVTQKAAFKNFPFQYGIVERTFSEHTASALSTTLVSDFGTLPPDLQRGALKRAYDQALLAGQNGNHEDGTPRYFSCQGCHMEPVVGQGAAFGVPPVRYDLAKHDLTGGNTWVPTAIQWLDSQTPSRLRLGKNLSPVMSAAMDRGVDRARATLQRAGALDVIYNGNTLRVTNLTSHKLITGYPEGRRMWLRMRWRDGQNNLLRDDGAYGSFTTNVNGTNYTVSSITDPNAHIYQVEAAISQDWALELLSLGVPPLTPLAFDHVTGQATINLAQLAASAPGTVQPTFHFVLNNTIKSDTRIPPYRLDRDKAARRNALPVPATQYGNPAPGGVYRHYDDVALNPPPGATHADIELLYQTASWDYVQFLRLANPGASAFLATAGQDLFDAYMATGGSQPEVMARARWCDLPGTNEDLVLKTGVNTGALDETCGKHVVPGDLMKLQVTSPGGTHALHVGALFLQLFDPSTPPITGLLPGLHIDNGSTYLIIAGVPASGFNFNITLPAGLSPQILRWQALMLTPNPANGLFALSDARDFWQD